ncbi:sigma factor-like helix-turn-helix DNA-binding protein [Ruminobacter sp. RM87]|uniref:sigma factor-like helix-turn-helix DNA-binding protein n=1 Tax=Ruminobacter sp. RM87 TaxID=1200567 RepID=UPI0004E13F81|nr:sigma factor-like helix-turn-helix DNA-binding protein [Ruminobacter sp. RM87]
MAKEIKWDNVTLTSDEVRTLNELRNQGKEVYAAPIEIEHGEQLESLGISWSQCRTWYIGNERITVHLTPADEATYRFLLGELHTRHRNTYRQNRCMVPGKTRLIRCPDSNSCANCPFPGYRDQWQPNVISWDEVIENEQHREEPVLAELFEAKRQYEEIRDLMIQEDPLIAEVFELKEGSGMTVKEIADRIGLSIRQIYYYLQKAQDIGRKYRER